MRNWIISLIVIILPVFVFLSLKKNKESHSAFIAHAANRPTVVKFASPMCLDCKKITKELAPLKEQYKGQVNFVEYDATATDSFVQNKIDKYGVNVVPTIIFLDKNDKKVKMIEGFVPKSQLEKYIVEIING